MVRVNPSAALSKGGVLTPLICIEQYICDLNKGFF